MRRIFFALLFIFTLLAIPSAPAFAATNNPLPSDDLTKQIEQKVASTVAKLNLVEKRGFVGTVTDVNDRQITVSDIFGNTRFIDVDEFTKFSSPESSSSFGISDIRKGDAIGVLGLYNKQSRRTLARFINVMNLPDYILGVVSQKSDDFTIIVSTSNGNSKVRIESVTKTYDVDNLGKLLRSGFTKISVGENIVVLGFPDPKDKSTITAGRVVLFPGVPQNPAIQLNSATPTQSPSSKIVPSTGSGLILTPVTK